MNRLAQSQHSPVNSSYSPNFESVGRCPALCCGHFWKMRRNMTGINNGPFSSDDAVVAIGLAFAGMETLQSKLLPAFSGFDGTFFSRLLDWTVLEWWPVLLIAGGVWVWLKDRRRKRIALTSQSGASK